MQKLPPKRPNLPAELFNMRELPPGGEEEEEEEEQEKEEAEKNEDDDDDDDKECPSITESYIDCEESSASISRQRSPSGQQGEPPAQSQQPRG